MLNEIREKFRKIVDENNLLNEEIFIKARVLTPEEAIGNPEEKDFPLLKGKERMIQADFKGSYGQAFTDMYGNFQGKISDIVAMELKNNYRRALFVASINAVMRYLKLIEKTIHCKDEEPFECSQMIEKFILENYPEVKKIALVGYQPAFVQVLSKRFVLNVLDLDRDNTGKMKFGVPILNGNVCTEDTIKWGDIVLVTGSVFVNGTIDEIVRYKNVDRIFFYGVTVAGIAELLHLNRLCFKGH